MFHLGPQFPIENEETSIKNVCYNNGNPISKKPRTCEITKMPLASNNAIMTGNFKTQQCSKFRFGNCRYGNKCFFAHGTGEVRHSLPNLQLPRPVFHEGKLGRNWNEDYTMLVQSNVCRMFYFRKECPYGNKCRFIHGNPENTKRDFGYCGETSVISIASGGTSGGIGSGFASFKPVNKKYKLCNNWERTGSCPYGKICCFAHGIAELEKPGDHVKLVPGFLPAKTPNNEPMGKDVIRTSYKQQVKAGLECTFGRKELEKISGIYGDWIEDLPFLHKNKAEICS